MLHDFNERSPPVRHARIDRLLLFPHLANHALLPITHAGESAIDRITTWENTVTQTQYGTYEDEDSQPPMLDVHIRHVLDVIDEAGAPVAAGSLLRLEDVKSQWAERKAELADITETDVATVNEWAERNGVPAATPPLN